MQIAAIRMIVFFPDSLRLYQLGFGAVAKTPVLFDNQQMLARIPSRYLRERALGRWLFLLGTGWNLSTALGIDVSSPEKWYDAYRSYVRQLRGLFSAFPDVDAVRKNILIEGRKVAFNPTTFESLNDRELELLFVATNFLAYEAKQGQYAIDDSFHATLLRTSITEIQKLKLIGEMDEAHVIGLPAVAGDIGPILDRSTVVQQEFGADFIKAVIINSRGTKLQVSLLNKFYPILSNADVREVVTRLPEAFRDIATFGKSPKIEATEINRQFATWLKKRGIISSFAGAALGDEIRIYTFRKEA